MAATQHGPFRVVPTNSDLSAQTGCALVKTAGFAALAGAAARAIEGVLVDDPVSGQSATVQVYDAARVKIGAAVADRALLTTDASGRFVTATTGQNVHAIALEAGAAANLFITAEIGYKGLA